MVSPKLLVLILYSEWFPGKYRSSVLAAVNCVVLLVLSNLAAHVAGNNVFYAIYFVRPYFYSHGPGLFSGL